MPYATVQDVRDALPQVPLTETTRPTTAAVQDTLDGLTARVDASLPALGYVMPIDPDEAPESYRLLKRIVLNAAVAEVLRMRAAGVDERTAAMARDYQAAWDRDWKALIDPRDPFMLPDAGRVVAAKDPTPSVPIGGSMADYYGEGAPPRFTRDQRF